MMATSDVKVGTKPTFSDLAVEQPTGRERSLANLRKGGGRPKGVPNKVNQSLKEMILGALEGAGGQQYLQRQADENPTAFLNLVGKVLPTELKQQVEGGITVNIVTNVPPPKDIIDV